MAGLVQSIMDQQCSHIITKLVLIVLFGLATGKWFRNGS